MTVAKLNTDFIAISSGEITVFNYDGVTREYRSSSVEYLAAGVGIPANSCTDMPGKPENGFAVCRTADFTAWEYVIDHRGKTVYSTETGEAITVSTLGDYPERTTTQQPTTPYDLWNGSDWATDVEAQHAAQAEEAEQQKASLLAEAQVKISFWQTELQLGLISDEDKALLIAWLKYMKIVQSIDASKAPGIEWPPVPDMT